MIITTAIINYDCHVTLKAGVMMLNYHRNKLQFNVTVILKENEIGSFCDSQTFFFLSIQTISASGVNTVNVA